VPRSTRCGSALAVALLAFAGCGGDSSGPSPFTVDGSWAGNGGGNNGSFALLIHLSEANQQITGTGGISGSVGRETSGSYIDGTFGGSGVPPTKISLHRQ
jgi:hypothetical protein